MPKEHSEIKVLEQENNLHFNVEARSAKATVKCFFKNRMSVLPFWLSRKPKMSGLWDEILVTELG